MSKNRVVYMSEALYAGPSPATGLHFVNAQGNKTGIAVVGGGESPAVNQLHRIQNVGYSFNVSRTDVNQFGELAAIDRVILESPTVSLDFSYLLANFGNEKVLGFSPLDGTSSCLSGMMSKVSDSRNYFIKTVPEGFDAFNSVRKAGDEVISVGNGFLTSYSTEGSVGGLPTVSVNVEGLNMAFDSGTGVDGGYDTPAIDPINGSRLTSKYRLPLTTGDHGTGTLNISVLRPGDISFSITQRSAQQEGNESEATDPYAGIGASIGATDAKIQSYSFNFDLSREAIQKLGNRFSFSREVSYPVNVSCSVDALVSDITTGSLSDIINCDDAYDITVKLGEPDGCAGSTSDVVSLYKLKNAKLDSQSYTSSIGDNKSVTLDFSAQIGGPNQTNLGFFMSGNNAGTNGLGQITTYDTAAGDSVD